MDSRGWAAVVLLGALLLAPSVLQLPFVSGAPPSNGQPIPITGYGLVTVSTGPQKNYGSTININILSNGFGAFFVSKLTLFLNTPAGSDLLLTQIQIDQITGSNSFIYLSQSGSPRVVVLPAGYLVGEVTSVICTLTSPNLSFLCVKDPWGNLAIVVSGGSNSGLKLQLQFGQPESASLYAEALVAAPTNNTISIAFS